MVKDFAGNKDYIQKLNAIEHSREAYVKGHNTPPGVPTQKGLTGDVEFISEAYPVVEFGNYDIPEGWENALAKPTQTGVPAQWENPNTTGFESDGEEETNLYFFHSDHLGSTNYLTDKEGVVQQSIVYQPYGEVLYEEKTYSNPYKFNGKELDTETGLAYYGARYYSPELSVWYGVDPLMEKYPQNGAYVFCNANPVKYIDPDGEKIEIGSFVGRVLAFLGVDNYESKVQKDLDELKKMDPELRNMITQLENSKETYKIIHPGNGGPDKKYNAYNKNKNIVYYDPMNKKTRSGVTRPPLIGLAHELGHAQDDENNIDMPEYNKDVVTNKVKVDPTVKEKEIEKLNKVEYNSIKKENIVRQNKGYPIRSFNYLTPIPKK